MKDIQKLVTMLKTLEDQMTVCMHCGLCQSVCPLFAQTLNEADVARGKICLLGGLSSEMLKDVQGVKERLDNCLMCGSCEANCPSGVSALEIFLKARVILTAYQGLSRTRQLILRGALAHPRLFDRILEMGARSQSFFVSPASELLGTSCSRIMSPLIGERHFMPLADVPFHRQQGSLDTPAGESGQKVAFYYGCLTDKIYPGIGNAVLKVLRYHGVGVWMPHEQACCGIPALSSGDLPSFKKLVRANLKAFGNKGFDALVTPCATCTSTIREFWPMFAGEFSEDEAAAIKAMAAKTTDISAFLVDSGLVSDKSAEPSANSATVTYHDPCHLKKSLKISAQPRRLLQNMPSCRFVEMNEADSCCGSGGSFNLLHYETSTAIGMRKRENIVASGAVTVATSCPACMMQMTDMLSRREDAVAVRHVIEVYAAALS